MMNIFKTITLSLLIFSCSTEAPRSDAYGNFEADIVTVSAETQGKLTYFSLEEGDELKAGSLVGLVDTSILHLQKQQILARIGSLSRKTLRIEPEIKVLQDQKSNLLRERDRIARLLKNKAATSKQLDDIDGELKVLDQRITASRSKAQNTNSGILSERDPLQAQVDLLEAQIEKAHIKNPISGRVLNKLAEAAEVVGPGSPLYRIAHLDPLVLHAYAAQTQLQDVSIGDEVEVLVDEGAEAFKRLKGRVSWVAAQAEFTPKTIQTKEDRVSLVYALKVQVPNPDGHLKIGMPAELNFLSQSVSQSSEK